MPDNVVAAREEQRRAAASDARRSLIAAGALLRARDRALELGLPHLRAALDVEPARLGLELLARRRVAATDGGRLLAERGARLRREVLQRLLLLRAGLRLLDVLARGLALLRGRHGDRATRSGFVEHGRTLRVHRGAAFTRGCRENPRGASGACAAQA